MQKKGKRRTWSCCWTSSHFTYNEDAVTGNFVWYNVQILVRNELISVFRHIECDFESGQVCQWTGIFTGTAISWVYREQSQLEEIPSGQLFMSGISDQNGQTGCIQQKGTRNRYNHWMQSSYAECNLWTHDAPSLATVYFTNDFT